MVVSRDVELLRTAHREFAGGNLLPARVICQGIVGRDKRAAGATFLLGQIAALLGDYVDAAAQLSRYTRLKPDDPRGHLLLAEVLARQGKDRQAIARFDKIPKRSPAYSFAVAGKADVHERNGRRDQARAVLAPFVEKGDETPEMAIVQARLDLHEGHAGAATQRIARHVDVEGVRPEARVDLLYLQAKALERAGHYDEAFEAARRANELTDVGYPRERWERLIEEIIEAFSAGRMAAAPRAAHGSELPVFVVGLPRSGTTLVERIIAAHPAAFGAGELGAILALTADISLTIGSMLPYPACVADIETDDAERLAAGYLGKVRRLDRTAERIVDKSLLNYHHLGLIAILFPQARVIRCRRDPMDNGVSCYFEPLVAQRHPYSTDLAAIGCTWRMHERLMAHWHEVLDIPILDLSYEALVADQEAESRRIIEFCGLAWDDRCLRYYESASPVRTLSYDQVNRPIYTSSVGRHKHYERHLGPLREAIDGAG